MQQETVWKQHWCYTCWLLLLCFCRGYLLFFFFFLSLVELRRFFLFAARDPHALSQVHDVRLAVRGGEIPLRVYVPRITGGSAHAFKGVLLWLHGALAFGRGLLLVFNASKQNVVLSLLQ